MLPVATAIQHVARFKVTASCYDLPQRQYFEELFNENGGIFSYDKNPRLPQNNAVLENFIRSPRKTGRRRSTDCFERDFKDMPEAELVAYFKLIILERRNK